MTLPSQKPYLIRAIYDWINDNDLTPHIVAFANSEVRVPQSYISDNKIVLNISNRATRNLEINKELISFDTSFNGNKTTIEIPINNIIAIFAEENKQGMQFNIDIQSLTKSKPTPKASSLKLVK